MPAHFTQKAKNVLSHALREAQEFGHTYVGSEHLLLGLLEETSGIAAHYLAEREVDPETVRRTILKLTGAGTPSRVSAADMTPRVKKIIELALCEAQQSGQILIGTEHLLLSLLGERDCVAVHILEELGVSTEDLRQSLIVFLGNSATAAECEKKRNDDPLPQKGSADNGILKNYGRDLTKLARNHQLDPIIGRERETERVIQILSRRTKNNPCLIGEPGVGKTAVAEGLAQRIAVGNVPEPLREKSIVTLDLASMIAGAKYRGEFEERLKNVLSEIRKCPNIILFIDEIHTLIGAGAAEGAIDAANIMKPALARGELQAIGATTISEYRKHIEKDPALERRFQAVPVGEPGKEEAILILKGLREKYEAHHRLKISDGAIDAAVTLSSRYIPDRFLPDKAIDLVDEAAAGLRIRAYTSPPELRHLENELNKVGKAKEEAIQDQQFEHAAQLRDREQSLKKEYDLKKAGWTVASASSSLTVTENEIAEVVTQWTEIPVHRILEEESAKLLQLEQLLHRRIVGQEEAIAAVSHAIRRSRMGLKSAHRPVGSFIFIGPTGIGKTELAKALSEVLFDEESALIRLDMSEYMEKHSVSKLIGAPPGYIGFDEGGQLTEKIRRKPYSVVLFDEIEKAHSDIFHLLLQILEDGTLTDSQGRKTDFRNAVLILTSNIGATECSPIKAAGFTAHSDTVPSAESQKGHILQELKKWFRPEFLNRIDEIICFRPLNATDMEEIADRMLQDLRQRILALGVTVEFSDSVKKALVDRGFDAAYGARPLRRAVIRMIEDPFSTEFLEKRISVGDRLYATIENDAVLFTPMK